VAAIPDQDRYFQGSLAASTPYQFTAEGVVSRLLNGRFVKGAITNAIGFDELVLTFQPTVTKTSAGLKQYSSGATFEDVLGRGDIQLVAPLENINGRSLIVVASGVVFQIDLKTLVATNITPKNAFLPEESSENPISYTDNDGGVYGVGGYLVIFNYPNKSIFINQDGSRLALDSNYEVPPSRMGVTAGSRLFIGSSDNLVLASDPFGGFNPLAPLTFEETLSRDSSYFDQIYKIGTSLDVEYITAMGRLPRYLSSSQEFLAQNVIISTNRRKYILNASATRDTWDNIQLISYAGSSDPIAGPLALTNIGDSLLYISLTGRIKAMGQDQQRETGMVETFMDDVLGQYLCPCESQYYFREWYKTLDHSRSILKFHKDRLYATVYPTRVPSINLYGEDSTAPTHKALAVASLDPLMKLGPSAELSWESFYDWLNPIGLVTFSDDLVVLSKNEYGANKIYIQNLNKVDEHSTVIYTRGYFSNAEGNAKSITEGSLYFRRLGGPVRVRVSYLKDNNWVCGSDGLADKQLHKFSFKNSRCRTDSSSIPLKIELEHKGQRFELEAIRVTGEIHREEKK
jgi:hypothetical protein